jgi:hypothetical protein
VKTFKEKSPIEARLLEATLRLAFLGEKRSATDTDSEETRHNLFVTPKISKIQNVIIVIQTMFLRYRS